MATKKSAKSAKKAAKAVRKAAAPSLSGLQKRLNKDTRLRSRFLKDPAAVLRAEGISLPEEKAASLERFTREVTAPAREVRVDSIRSRAAGLARTEVEVVVSVGVRF